MSKAFLEILHKFEEDKKKQDETREKEMVRFKLKLNHNDKLLIILYDI